MLSNRAVTPNSRAMAMLAARLVRAASASGWGLEQMKARPRMRSGAWRHNSSIT